MMSCDSNKTTNNTPTNKIVKNHSHQFMYAAYALLSDQWTQLENTKSDGLNILAILVDSHGDIVEHKKNEIFKKQNAWYHAETSLVKEALDKIKSYYLVNNIVFSTSKPCLMCRATLSQLKISEIYYGLDYQLGNGDKTHYEIEHAGFANLHQAKDLISKQISNLHSNKVESKTKVMQFKEIKTILDSSYCLLAQSEPEDKIKRGIMKYLDKNLKNKKKCE